MNKHEKIQVQTYEELLLDHSLDDGIPGNLRGKSIEEIQRMIDELNIERIPMSISKWDFAPDEARIQRETLQEKKMSLFESARDIRDNDELDGREKELRRAEIFEEIDAMDLDPRAEPKVYDEAKYKSAVREREALLIKIENKEKLRNKYQIVIKNLETLQDEEIHEVDFKTYIDRDTPLQKEIETFPVIFLPEGFVNLILEKDINNKQEAKYLYMDLIARININYKYTERSYNIFINHLRGHKIVRHNLFKYAADNNIVLELPKLGIPIMGLANSLSYDLQKDPTNFYARDFHEIVWRFPNDITFPSNTDNFEAHGSDGEVIFEGNELDYAYEQGAEENSHAFYYKEEGRDTDIDNFSHERKRIKYHSKKDELNALYGILGAYITKYGSESNIPKQTYNALMNLIQMSVNERISTKLLTTEQQ